MVNAFSRLLAPINRRIRQLFTRGLVRMVDSATLMQSLQIELLQDELLDGVEHAEPYGYTSHPHPGAEVFTASVGGRRAHTIALIAADRRYRKKGLAAGEVALYTDEGDYILLQRGRVIKVVAGTALDVTAPQVNITASTKVTMTTPVCEITGNLTVGGNAAVGGNATITGAASAASLATSGAVVAGGGVTSAGIVFGTHRHGGVQTGAGISGGPQ